jgi:hypothetical protein
MSSRVAGISDEEYAHAAALLATASLDDMRDLERRAADPDYAMTAFEAQAWVLLVEASKPDELPEHVIVDEGDEWPPDPPSHAAWDAWYDRPIADSIAQKRRTTLLTGAAAAPRRGPARRSTPRATRSRRARSRSRARRSSDDDPHEHDLARRGRRA